MSLSTVLNNVSRHLVNVGKAKFSFLGKSNLNTFTNGRVRPSFISVGRQYFCSKSESTNKQNSYAYDALLKKHNARNWGSNGSLFAEYALAGIESSRQNNHFERYTAMCKLLTQETGKLGNSDNQFALETLMRDVTLLDDHQLLYVVGTLPLWATISQGIRGLQSHVVKIKAECETRLSEQSTILQMFDMLHAWYPLYGNFQSQLAPLFNKVNLHLSHKITEMATEELVEYLFFLNVARSFPATLNPLTLEQCLFRVKDQFSLDDLGTLSMGYFKCKQSFLTDAFSLEMISRVRNNIAAINEMTLASTLKVLRKSCRRSSPLKKSAISLQRVLVNEMDRKKSIQVWIQAALLSTELNYFDPHVLEKVIERFLNDNQQARLKDFERLALCIALSNHQSDNADRFWQITEDELNKSSRQSEIDSFPRSLVSMLVYFIYTNRYPEQLLRRALHPNAVKAALDDSYSNTGRELFTLDASIRIERPNYHGPRLSSAIVHRYTQLNCRPLPQKGGSKLTHSQRFLLELLKDSAAVLGGDNYVHLGYLLPHISTPDLFFNVDGEALRTYPTIERVSSNQRKWCVLIAGTRGMYNMKNNDQMGILRLKTRQYQVLGIQTVEIPWFHFLHLDTWDRRKYLRQKINQLN